LFKLLSRPENYYGEDGDDTKGDTKGDKRGAQ